jgi:hypothetical protein
MLPDGKEPKFTEQPLEISNTDVNYNKLSGIINLKKTNSLLKEINIRYELNINERNLLTSLYVYVNNLHIGNIITLKTNDYDANTKNYRLDYHFKINEEYKDYTNFIPNHLHKNLNELKTKIKLSFENIVKFIKIYE